MAILGIDTSTSLVSLGLIEQRPLAELTFEGGRRHLTRLIPWLDQLLSESGYSLAHITGIACVTGPGSFSGLRIGLATIQGISLALAIPIVGVCSLDVFAQQAVASDVWVLIHSRSHFFFYAHYQHRLRNGEVRIGKLSEIVPQIADNSKIVTPHLENFRKQMACLTEKTDIEVESVMASGVRVALLGRDLLQQGKTLGPSELHPYYLASSYAENKTDESLS